MLVSLVSGVSVSSLGSSWNLTFFEEALRTGLGLAGTGELVFELEALLFLDDEEKKEGLLDLLEGLGLFLPVESPESAPEDRFLRKNPSTMLVTRTLMLSSPSTSTKRCCGPSADPRSEMSSCWSDMLAVSSRVVPVETRSKHAGGLSCC